jgi:RNA polymerase sigma-70 factor (ECF subfamily)
MGASCEMAVDCPETIGEAADPGLAIVEAHFADDASLVRAAQAGDRSAFDELYHHHARLVHGLLLARVPADEADDLTQDVFLVAWRQLSSLREPAAFCGWLIQIARRRATDFHRASHDVTELADDTAPQGPRQSHGAEAAAVLRAVRQLPEAYRETLILRLVEGMTGPEIAARTGLANGSVRVNLHRGMKLLREKLEGRSGNA